jgi:hypothetical protein
MSHVSVYVTEQFDWLSPEGETSISFRVTAMLADITSGRLPAADVTTELSVEFADTWVSQRELNLEYVRGMSDARRNMPVLGVCMPDETVLLIDGSHRYMARRMHGDTTVDYKLVALGAWEPYATIKGKWP